jgi:hypothetical protein
MLRLIYPKRRNITESEVIRWAMDRIADNMIDVESLRARDEGRTLTDEEVEHIIASVPPPTLEDAIERLEDDGVATFSKVK